MRLDLKDLDPDQKYKVLSGVVLPRPIALITTVSTDGIVNAAPYSFFNVLSDDPPLVAIGIQSKKTGGPKDTTTNIRNTDEFVVNLADDIHAWNMVICGSALPEDVDELPLARFTPTPSTHVKPPRITECPVALECRRYMMLEPGQRRTIVMGEVLAVHVRDDMIDRDNLRVDGEKMGLIGRLHGPYYANTRDIYAMAIPKPEDVLSGKVFENPPEGPKRG